MPEVPGNLATWILFAFLALPALGLAVLVVGLVTTVLFGEGFWRDRGQLVPLLNVAVLLVAYVFYAGEQPRAFLDAARDAVTAEVTNYLPQVVGVELVLLCLFWLLAGLVMGLPVRLLLAPVEAVVKLAAVMALCAVFGAFWLELFAGADRVLAVAGLVGTCLVAGLVLAADYHNPYSLGLGRELRTQGLEPGQRPRRESFGGSVGSMGLLFAFCAGAVAGLVTFVGSRAGLGPPPMADVLRVELVVFAVVFVIWYFRFRLSCHRHPDVPSAMAGLTNLGLAGTAVLVAASGVGGSPVLLGPVPPLLVAVLPGLVVGLAVFVFDVHPHRSTTPRYGLSLAITLLGTVVGLVTRPTIGRWVAAGIAVLPLP